MIDEGSSLTAQILSKPKPLKDKNKIAAITTKARFVRVIAGAGAGKTETLTRRIVYLLLVEKVPPSAIVAFTFTERAAQSMKERIYERVGQLDKTMVDRLGEMYIGTIHAYAKRLLEDHFDYGIHTLLDENQEVAFLLRQGWGLGLKDYDNNYTEACRAFLRTSSMVLDELLDQNLIKKEAPDFFKRLSSYYGVLDEHKLLTFSRVIYAVVQKLQTNPDPISGIKHLIVDEYQDINRAQSELINIIGNNASVFVVGDPRQSIYQWRGSNEFFFSDFEHAFPGCQTYIITENHRSGAKIVRSANRVAATFERAKYGPMSVVRTEDGFVGIAVNETPDDEAKWIVDQIERLVKNGMRYSDIGILTRSVRTSAGPLVDILNEKGIPFLVGGKIGLFRRGEARAMGLVFTWFHDEGFWGFGKTQITGDTLLTEAATSWETAAGRRAPNDLREKLDDVKKKLYSQKGSYHTITSVFQDVLKSFGFLELDPTDKRHAAVMANLGRFNTLLTDYETANRIGGKKPSWNSHLKGLMWFMNSYATASYEEQQAADMRGVDAIQIMTVHQAKGLEWPVVFLFATNNRRFPTANVGKQLNWCGIPRTLFDAGRYETGIEDERRLFYVAITRAMDALVVSHFQRISNSVQRSEFIGGIESQDAQNLPPGTPLPALKLHPSPDEDEMQTISASEVITYRRCPYQYRLGYEWGYQPGLNPRIGYGKALHFCLGKAGKLVMQQKGLNPASAAAEVVDKCFFMPFVGGELLDQFRASAKRDLVGFVRKYGADLTRIRETEYRIEFPVEKATITGKVDVILQEGGGLEVRDYKTSDEAMTTAESALQVQLYSNGLESRKEPIIKGSVAYLQEPKVIHVGVDPNALKASKEKANEAVRGIRKEGNFIGCIGEHCHNCDFGEICAYNKGGKKHGK